MIKMAARAMNCKTLSECSAPEPTKHGMYDWGIRPIIIHINYNLSLTLTYFIEMSNLVTYNRFFNGN